MRSNSLQLVINISIRAFIRVKYVAPCVVIIGAIAYVNYSLPTNWIILSSLAILTTAMIRPGAVNGSENIATKAPELSQENPVKIVVCGMQSIVASLPESCFLLRSGGEIIYQNSHAQQVFGVLGQGTSIYSILRATEVREAVERTVTTRCFTQVQYFERVPAERMLDVYVAPVDDRCNRGLGDDPIILLMLRDLSQQYHLDRMRTDFIANASHELRTPLASLIGFIDTLQGPAREDVAVQEKFLTIMGSQAGRMSRLIDDLLSLSLIEMNANVRPGDTVNLSEVAAHVVDTLKSIAEKADVELLYEFSESDFFVLGFRDELVQVVQNLIENAIKYGQDGGKVEIVLRRELSPAKPDQILLEVRDFGPGIEPEHLPRLTERFYRVDVASSREKGGTGLGLAIVKHILNRHRSGLKIASKPGDGATFSFILEAISDTKKSS